MSCIIEENIHIDCPYCPHPCQNCGEFCFSGKCYGCFPERILPCQECGEKKWDGECNCLENEEEEEILQD